MRTGNNPEIGREVNNENQSYQIYVMYKIFLCIHIIVEVGKHIQNIWNFKEILFLERWKFKYELKINHAKLCIKIDNIQNIFVNDPKYFCRVELKHDRRASRLTSPGLEIDITLALPLPRLLCHYQLWLRAILYTVLSHQRTSRGELLLSVQRGQANLDKRRRLERG